MLFSPLHARFFWHSQTHHTMKVRKIIGGFVAIVGLVLAVCTADNSAYEVLLRGIGIGMVAVGAFIARAFDFQTKKDYGRRSI